MSKKKPYKDYSDDSWFSKPVALLRVMWEWGGCLCLFLALAIMTLITAVATLF